MSVRAQIHLLFSPLSQPSTAVRFHLLQVSLSAVLYSGLYSCFYPEDSFAPVEISLFLRSLQTSLVKKEEIPSFSFPMFTTFPVAIATMSGYLLTDCNL